MELSLQTRTDADRVVLEVGGEIDVYTAPRLRERLLELIADGVQRIVVDLEAVEFLDSTGLGVLVGGLKGLKAKGGHLALVCTQERILKIFRITGLATFFDIHDSVEAAASAVAAPQPGATTQPDGTTREAGPDDPADTTGASAPPASGS